MVSAWQHLSDQVTQHTGWTPDKVLVQGSEAALADAFIWNDLVVVSDGSFDTPLGTAATIVTTLSYCSDLSDGEHWVPTMVNEVI